MHDTNTVRSLLTAVVEAAGSKAETCRRLHVDKKTLDNWLNASPGAPVKIQPAHAERISQTALELGIEAELYQELPPLWDFSLSYDANRDNPVYSHVDIARPFINWHVEIPALQIELRSPFGVASSILTCTVDRVDFLSHAGNDVVVFKTVRSDEHDPLPAPNMAVVTTALPNIDPHTLQPSTALVRPPAAERGIPRVWVNSWGMPCDAPAIWMEKVRSAQAGMKASQLLIVSIVGSASVDEPVAALVADFVRVATLALGAGATVIELNLSCPNCQGREGEVYRDLDLSTEICRAVKEVTGGSARLVVKLGYLPKASLRTFVEKTFRFVDGYSVINTFRIRALEERKHGYEPLPVFGTDRACAGLSGDPLFALGIDAVTSLRQFREALGGRERFAIIGVGGVNSVGRVTDYLNAGADLVLAASIFFDDPLFGVRVQRHLERRDPQRKRTRDDEEERAYFNVRLALARPSLREVVGARRAARDVFAIWADANRSSLQSSFRRSEIPDPALFEKMILDEIGRTRMR